jgi:hypothetical protein
MGMELRQLDLPGSLTTQIIQPPGNPRADRVGSAFHPWGRHAEKA